MLIVYPLLEEAGGVGGTILDGREQVHRPRRRRTTILRAQKDGARQLRQRDRAGAGRLLLGDGAVDDLALREDLVAVAQKAGLVRGVLAAVGEDQDALLVRLRSAWSASVGKRLCASTATDDAAPCAAA